MNNELILKQYDIVVQINKYRSIYRLKEFLTNNKSYFVKSESVEAIKAIEEKIKKIEDVLKKLYDEKKLNEKEIRKTCKHEVINKNYDQGICMICNYWLFINEIDFNHIFIETENSINEIEKIIYLIAKNNESILEDFMSYTGNLNVDKVKVYKRMI